ncbi:permease [Halarsenatibacter silvermanii]|uniref:Predicted permease n=1 Tax=Halarsenatibacter silvermanii TaxID=321763 RepID=A0A1G9ID20_9FIRM|nr:permease [Halarsenatibacter silvermanii]SDL22935.1 Predicted permease [Halarsenatibacter silvermanii]
MKTQKLSQKIKKLAIFLIITAVMLYVIRIFFPTRSDISFEVMKNYGLEVTAIFLPVLVLMGLADVWIPREKIKKYLGQESGFKGVFISLFMGTLPTGPMFIAFPIAGELIKKEARIANVVVFLGAWASLKMPQIGVEIQFLGLKFSVYRVILTFIAIISIAFLTEKLDKLQVKA